MRKTEIKLNQNYPVENHQTVETNLELKSPRLLPQDSDAPYF